MVLRDRTVHEPGRHHLIGNIQRIAGNNREPQVFLYRWQRQSTTINVVPAILGHQVPFPVIVKSL